MTAAISFGLGTATGFVLALALLATVLMSVA